MRLRYVGIVWLFLVLLLVSGCIETTPGTAENKSVQGSEVQDKLILAGSGSNIPVTRKLAEGYNGKANAKIEVPSSIGSEGAINAVKSGKLELGLISRHLTAAEREQGLKEIPYARVAVILGVHKDVPDTEISSSNIINIVKGFKASWSNGSKIFVFVREREDSSNLVLYDKIPGFKDALSEAYEDHRWEIVYRDNDMASALQRTRGSWGVVNTTDLVENDAIKALALDGVAPTQENVLSGRYKLVKDLSFVYLNQLNSRSAKFLEFVYSPEGQQILAKWGAVPTGR